MADVETIDQSAGQQKGEEPYICHKLPLVLLKYLSLQTRSQSVRGLLDKISEIEQASNVTLYKGNASMLCSDVRYLERLGLLNVDLSEKREESIVEISGFGTIFSRNFQTPEYILVDPNTVV